MSGGVTILLVGIIIIAAILAAVVALTRQGGKVLNTEKYQARWLAIENSLDKSNIGTYQLPCVSVALPVIRWASA